MSTEIKINREELSKKRLMVAVPMYGGQCHGMFTRSMIDLGVMLNHWGVKLQLYFLFNESLITRARNYCADEFLRSDCTHLMFIDSDIGFSPQDVMAMLALSSDESEHHVLCGPYPKKCISWEKIKTAVDRGFADEDPKQLERFVGDFVFNPLGNQTSIPLNQPTEVLESGTGFMMIQRKAFEMMKAARPDLSYKPDHVRTEHFDGSREITAYFMDPIDRVSKEKVYEEAIQRIADVRAKGASLPELIDVMNLAEQTLKIPEQGSKRLLSEDYFFCAPANARIETEDGVQNISKIVSSKYTGKVKSLDANGNFVWSDVIGWSARPNTGKLWVKVNTTADNNTKAKLRCTDDHRVAYFEDVMNPQVEYTEAKNLVGKYMVRFPDDRKVNRENALYNREQLSFMVGTLLGDSTISRANQFSSTHCDAQVDYLKLKQSIFGGKIVENIKQGKDSFSPRKIQHMLYVPVNAQTKYLRELFYNVDGTKNIGRIIDLIDEKALAFWYLDDGSHHKVSGTYLATYNFTYDEHLVLQGMLGSKWGIDVRIDEKRVEYKGKVRTYYGLRFNKEAAEKLFSLIAPFVPDCMKYKLLKEYWDVVPHTFDTQRLGFAGAKVKEVEYLPNLQSKLYDIEVADTHNFIANGTVVHNCQEVRKAGAKVWLCPWMRLQHAGSYIFGGSLTDLAQIGATATASPEELAKKPSKAEQLRLRHKGKK